MNKILSYAAVALGALTLGSCSDFLDQNSPSEQNTETTYNSVYSTGLVVNKIYGDMGRDYTYSQVIPIIWGAGTDTELIDGLGTGVETVSERGYMNYRMNESGWSRIGGWWTDNFSVLEYCNLVIEGVENSKLYNTEEDTADKKAMQRYLGEALTLRAMVYHDLIRMWGDVPMKMESTQPDLSNAYNSKTDRDVILDQLLADLEKAQGFLPWAYDVSGYTTEHVTKGYAKALYAQIALTRAGYAIRETPKSGYETAEYSDATFPTQRPAQAERQELYRKAAFALADIIKSGKHSLNPSYENEWYLLNQLTLDKNSRENIFEIPMLENVTGELGYTVGKRMNGVTTDFGYGNSSGKLKTTATHFYSYHPADTRRDVTCAVTQFSENNGKTTEAFIGNAPFGIYVGKWRPEWMGSSWLAQNKAASAKHLTGINVVRMRYSQVLLYYAECLNELVGPNESLQGTDLEKTARQALAEVHLRAFDGAADKKVAEEYITAIPSDHDSFLEAIMQENAWELTGEGVRKFDLIRWGVLAQKIADMKKNYAELCLMWPSTLYFKYTDETKSRIDLSSVNFYEAPFASKEEGTAAGYENASGFGFYDVSKSDPSASAIENRDKNNNYTVNLPRICEGLVGITIDGTIGEPVNLANQPVKNRYILPIYTTTIADSEGTLKNSYGY